MRIKTNGWVFLALVMSGCATMPDYPTKAKVNQIEVACREQVLADQAARRSDWFSQWMQCKLQYQMPLELSVYADRQAEIREMYAKLMGLSLLVDGGFMHVGYVYDAWDRMMVENGMMTSVCTHFPDGSQQCHAPNVKDTVYVMKKDGSISSVR